MDEERIEASGVEPIRADLAAIYATTTIAELIALSGSFFRRGVSGFIQAGASSDAGSPERNLLTLIQGGLGCRTSPTTVRSSSPSFWANTRSTWAGCWPWAS